MRGDASPTTRPSTSGLATGTPVDDQNYQVPFKVTGKLAKLRLSIEGPSLTMANENGSWQESGAQPKHSSGWERIVSPARWPIRSVVRSFPSFALQLECS
jgi:hypothetical protein